MKKAWKAMAMAVLLAGCTVESIPQQEEIVEIKVTAVEGISQQELDAQSKELGFDSIALEDGFVVYRMTSEKRDEEMARTKKEIDDMIESALSYEGCEIQSVSYNDDMSTFEVALSGEESFLEIMFEMSFYTGGMWYQLLEGKDEKDVDVVVSLIDAKTKEVIVRRNGREFREFTQGLS